MSKNIASVTTQTELIDKSALQQYHKTLKGKYIKSLSIDSDGKVITPILGNGSNGTSIKIKDYNEATSSALGLVKIGYVSNGKNYPVQLNNGQMYVNVPWIDTNTKVTQIPSLSANKHSMVLTERSSSQVGTSDTDTVINSFYNYIIPNTASVQQGKNIETISGDVNYAGGDTITISGGNNIFAYGYGLTSSIGNNKAIIGQWNKDVDARFIVGVGNSTKRFNIVEVAQDTVTINGGLTIGSKDVNGYSNTLKVNGALTVSGDANITGALKAKNIQASEFFVMSSLSDSYIKYTEGTVLSKGIYFIYFENLNLGRIILIDDQTQDIYVGKSRADTHNNQEVLLNINSNRVLSFYSKNQTANEWNSFAINVNNIYYKKLISA